MRMNHKKNATGALLCRNMKIFLRDKGAVFFSLLSMLIVLALMLLFLGSMNSDTIVGLLETYGGKRDAVTDRANADHLVRVWALAGILLVNCVTVTMTVMGNLIHDEEEGKLASFYIAPVSRARITLGYILSAWIIGAGMSLFTLLIGNLLLIPNGGGLSAKTCLTLAGMILANSFLYAAFSYLLTLFVHSSGAWNGLLTVSGTLVGFLGGIYLPMEMLPEKVCTLMKALPVLHGASMMRRVCVQDALAETFSGLSAAVAEGYSKGMGITVSVNGEILSVSMQLLFVLLLGVGIVVLSALISMRRTGRDR